MQESHIENLKTVKEIFNNFELKKNIPIDKRYLISDMTNIDVLLPMKYRYGGLIFFGLNDGIGNFYCFESDATIDTPKLFSDYILNLNVNQLVYNLEEQSYVELVNDLTGITTKPGSIIHILPLDILVMFNGTTWEYISGNYKVSNQTEYNAIPADLKKKNEVVYLNGDKKIILSDLTLSDEIISVTELPDVPEENRYYIFNGFLYYSLSNNLYKLNDKISVNDIVLPIGVTNIEHSLISTNIFVLFRLKNNNDNPSIKIGKTFNLDYISINENNIELESDIEMDGELILLIK